MDNTLEIKIEAVTKAVQEGLKGVGTGINNLCKLVENGNDLNTEFFQELGKTIVMGVAKNIFQWIVVTCQKFLKHLYLSQNDH